jgi:hypothetical protein
MLLGSRKRAGPIAQTRAYGPTSPLAPRPFFPRNRGAAGAGAESAEGGEVIAVGNEKAKALQVGRADCASISDQAYVHNQP